MRFERGVAWAAGAVGLVIGATAAAWLSEKRIAAADTTRSEIADLRSELKRLERRASIPVERVPASAASPVPVPSDVPSDAVAVEDPPAPGQVTYEASDLPEIDDQLTNEFATQSRDSQWANDTERVIQTQVDSLQRSGVVVRKAQCARDLCRIVLDRSNSSLDSGRIMFALSLPGMSGLFIDHAHLLGGTSDDVAYLGRDSRSFAPSY